MTTYLAESTDLASVADAIRAKGGTNLSLSFPAGFVSAISAIETGGGITADDIAMRTISGDMVGPTATYIFSSAFYYCTNITAASFPECLVINPCGFTMCSNLKTANFPKCTRTYASAFANCSELTTINFPKCSYISASTFYGCGKLTSANLPECESINAYAFAFCRSMSIVSFPVAQYIGNSAFQTCFSLTMVDFPLCESVASGAFFNCTNLATASFPVCTSISTYAFRSCYRLTSLYLTSVSKVPTLGANAFSSTPIGGYSASAGQYGSVFVPASLYNSFLTATNWTSISARIVSV